MKMSARRSKIICIGLIGIDNIEVNGYRHSSRGGAAYHFTIASALLGTHIKLITSYPVVKWKETTEALQRLNVDISLVKNNENEIEFYLKYNNGHDELLSFRESQRDVGNFIRNCSIEQAIYRSALVHVCPMGIRNDMRIISLAVKKGANISAQVHESYLNENLVEYKAALKYCSIVFMNECEGRYLSKRDCQIDACKALHEELHADILITSSSGVICCNAGEIYKCASVKGIVKNTTGSGDVFAGAYLGARIRGLPIQNCLRIGQLFSSVKCMGFSSEVLLSLI